MYAIPRYRKHAGFYRLTCLIAFSPLVGCRSHGLTPITTDPTTAPVIKAKELDTEKDAGTFQIYSPGNLRYRVEIKSFLQPMTGDSVHRPDSSEMTAIILVHLASISSDKEILAHVQVDSTTLRTIDNTSITLPTVTYTFHINRRTKRIVSDRARDCSDTATSELPIYGMEILPAIGTTDLQQWSDTSEIQTCRTGILVRLKRIAAYSTIDRSLTPIQIVRRTVVVMNGSGYQWNQKVNIDGQGEAVDTLVISSSRLQQVQGTARLELNFSSALRHQSYVQTTSTKVILQH